MSGKRVRSMSFNVNDVFDKQLLKLLDSQSNKNKYLKKLITEDFFKRAQKRGETYEIQSNQSVWVPGRVSK
jgi:hypothetical protein